MKVTTERLENCIVALDIQVDDQETDQYLHSAARKIAREYRIPGFRPGKAPYHVVVRRFGVDAVRGQVFDQFGDKIFEAGLKESGLEPADQASLEEVTWEPFTLHLKVPVAPEVDLGAYRDIRVDWEAVETTDEDLEEELLRLRRQHVEWEEDVERGAELGDQVVIDITGTIDGNVVLGNTAREMVLNADSPYPVPGFAGQVVGMKVGETREFDLTYPEDHYNPDSAGKTAHFEAKLHGIKVENLPELNDEFAHLVGDYENIEALKAGRRQALQEDAENQAKDEYLEQIWARLFETAHVVYPPVYVERELEAIQQQLEGQLKQSGMDLESYFRLTNTNEADWKESIRPQADERLKRRLILAEVAVQEKLKVEQAEIDAEIDRLVDSDSEQAQNMRDWLRSPTGMQILVEDLVTNKTIERLEAIARGQAPSLEELVAESEDDEAPATDEEALAAGEAQDIEAETVTAVSEAADAEPVVKVAEAAVDPEVDAPAAEATQAGEDGVEEA